MLLTLLAYAYLQRGAVDPGDRGPVPGGCHLPAGVRRRLVPDHSTISRFRQRACGDGGPVEDVFYAVLRVCAAAGLGGLSVVAVDGVKIGANASKEANRTEAGLRKLAAAIHGRGSSRADEPDAAETGQDLFGGEALSPEWADPRSRLGPGAGVPGGLRRAAGGRRGQAAGAGPGVAGRAGCRGAGGQAAGERWRRRRRGSRWRPRWPGIRRWSMGGTASGPRGSRAGKKPVPVRASRRVARQRERLARAEAAARTRPRQEEEAGDGETDGTGKKKDKPRPVRNVADRPLGADAGSRRRAEAGLQLPGRRRR